MNEIKEENEEVIMLLRNTNEDTFECECNHCTVTHYNLMCESNAKKYFISFVDWLIVYCSHKQLAFDPDDEQLDDLEQIKSQLNN